MPWWFDPRRVARKKRDKRAELKKTLRQFAATNDEPVQTQELNCAEAAHFLGLTVTWSLLTAGQAYIAWTGTRYGRGFTPARECTSSASEQ